MNTLFLGPQASRLHYARSAKNERGRRDACGPRKEYPQIRQRRLNSKLEIECFFDFFGGLGADAVYEIQATARDEGFELG